MTEAPDSHPIVTIDKIRSALTWYRVLAWMTGIWLIALCYELILKYVHGWVYFVYLLFTANLAVKVRWGIAKTIGVLLAGTIPLLGIIVEQVQTREIKERFNL